MSVESVCLPIRVHMCSLINLFILHFLFLRFILYNQLNWFRTFVATSKSSSHNTYTAAYRAYTYIWHPRFHMSVYRYFHYCIYRRSTRDTSESATCVYFYPFIFPVTMCFHLHSFIYPFFSVCQFAVGIYTYFGRVTWRAYMYQRPKYSCNSILLADTTGFKRKSIKCVWLVFYRAWSPQYITQHLNLYIYFNIHA